MANKVLAGYVTRICEIYIDDLLVHGRTDDKLLDNLRKILVRLRTNRVTNNPEKTELGLDEVEYTGKTCIGKLSEFIGILTANC